MTTATYEIKKQNHAATVTNYVASANVGFDETTNRVTVYGKEYAISSIWLQKKWTNKDSAPTSNDSFLTVTIGVYSLRANGTVGTKFDYKEVYYASLADSTNLPIDFIRELGVKFNESVADIMAGA